MTGGVFGDGQGLERVAGEGLEDGVAVGVGVGAGAAQGDEEFVDGGAGVRAQGLRLDAFEDAGAVAALAFREPAEGGATGLYRGRFDVSGAGDASLRLPGWVRGFVWVNGLCLGRYWAAGPQESLYVPGPVLREGGNEVWVLELDRAGGRFAEFG